MYSVTSKEVVISSSLAETSAAPTSTEDIFVHTGTFSLLSILQVMPGNEQNLGHQRVASVHYRQMVWSLALPEELR